MNKLVALAIAGSSLASAPAFAATVFNFDVTNSYVNVTSNPTSCRLLGQCPLTASLVTPFQSFSLDVGESSTFDFAQFLVGSGFGTGSATLEAQLAFLSPNASPAGTGGSANYFRVGGLFTPGVLGGSLTWNTPSQQVTSADGTRFTVNFGGVSGAQFGGTTRAPVTITLDSVSAVPEPGTWAMLLSGFGAIGYSLRRRSRYRVVQAV